MIKSFSIDNFGPLNNIDVQKLDKINLIIGPNSSGKTFLLKALYSVIRAQEETGRGNENRDFAEILSDKMYWTFQPDKLGDLVTKGSNKRLKLLITLEDKSGLAFEFGPDTSKKIIPSYNNLSDREANSVFLPPKEVLSLSKTIMKSVLHDKVFGFDSTYSDLVLALQTPTQKGKNYSTFTDSRKQLESMFEGKIEYDSSNEKWIYKTGNKKFSINTTAEGIKKIAILDTLLGNRYISPESIIFIDEPESALHPKAISQLLEIISMLADSGIQFFMASHSYFVVKKLYILAKQKNWSIPILSASDNKWIIDDLKDGMPANSIIDQSIHLYEEEVELVLG